MPRAPSEAEGGDRARSRGLLPRGGAAVLHRAVSPAVPRSSPEEGTTSRTVGSPARIGRCGERGGAPLLQGGGSDFPEGGERAGSGWHGQRGGSDVRRGGAYAAGMHGNGESRRLRARPESLRGIVRRVGGSTGRLVRISRRVSGPRTVAGEHPAIALASRAEGTGRSAEGSAPRAEGSAPRVEGGRVCAEARPNRAKGGSSLAIDHSMKVPSTRAVNAPRTRPKPSSRSIRPQTRSGVTSVSSTRPMLRWPKVR